MSNYTADQIGPIDVRPINSRTKGQYSLVLIQPGDNTQIAILESCDWDIGNDRAIEMISRGVDPLDLRFTHRQRDQLKTDGLQLRHIHEALWASDPLVGQDHGA